MVAISLENVNKVYEEGHHAVKNFNLTIEGKEFVVFVGPSGCGKSTTLRMIAGLEDISAGKLELNGQIINNVEPMNRDVAMVFQNYALYPHMTVFDNMAFSLKMKKIPKAEIKKRVNEAAGILGLEELLTRKPKQLSGGQRQRVALGRAIVREPKLFLMDEPLSNLDAKLRVEMRREIIKLYNQMTTPFIYVTHDQTEAMTMGTKIVVMKDGDIQQVGEPKQIYEQPANMFVAGFVGSPQMNFIHASLVEVDNEVFALFDGMKLFIPSNKAMELKNKSYMGKEVILGIRPHVFTKKENESSMVNTIVGKVELTELNGAETYLHIKLSNHELVASIPSNIMVNNGENISLSVDLNQIHIFDSETEETIVH